MARDSDLNGGTNGDTSATAGLLIDARDMARRLNVHESWVRTEQRAGRIPFVQVGRYVRFNPAQVQAALIQRNLSSEK